MAISFDECFQTFPKLIIPSDLESFWAESIKELKSIPISNTSKALLKSSIIRETVYDISFQSSKRYQINGTLVIPRKRGDLPVVVYFHDYMGKRPEIKKAHTEHGIAQLILDLRGHGDQLIRPEATEAQPNLDWTPGYFLEGLEKKEDFYVKHLYLDVLRAIEFLRLTDGIDGDRIILHGKSFGASLAIFGTAFSERVKGVVAETPNFCYIEDEQLACEAGWSKELSRYASKNKTRKTSYKKTLAYFDSVNFANKIKVPALFSCGLDDKVSHPKSSFALFNHLNCDKRMQLYPNEGNDAGKEKQNAVNVEFYKEVFGLDGN
ncbi:MAG: acetylxylan esterase [Leptospiraceae bacterium]|nr:acetylxylan esterase [Leptospiraceae bacterium]